MRLRVESIKVAGGMIGERASKRCGGRQPVRPDDSIRAQAEILQVRHSTARPTYGVIRSQTTVYNQRDEVVMRSVVNWLARSEHKVGAHAAADR